jgi:hypothetical protein
LPKKFVVISVGDYGLVLDTSLSRNVAISVYDAVSVSDSLNTIVVKTVPASDFVLADSTTYSKSYSPLFFTLLRRRMPVRYLTLSVADSVPILDSASIVRIKVVSVLDAVAVADYAAVKNIVIHADDYTVISDSASAAKMNVVSVADYIVYDYVPHLPPYNFRYISLYANVGVYIISVFDVASPYESVWVGPRVVTVHAWDYLASDSATAVKRAIHTYDVLMYDNANIVRIT